MSQARKLISLLILALFATSSPGVGDEPSYEGQSVTQWQVALASPDLSQRHKAAYALGRIGPRAAAAVPALNAALADPRQKTEVAWYLADALGRIGPAAAPAVKTLVGVIEETPGNAVLKRNAAIALGRVGPGASAAATALLKLMADADAETRVAATAALWQIDRRDAARLALLAELKLPGGPGPLAAALAVGDLELGDEQSVSGLAAVLDSPDADVRRAAVESLSRLGAPAVVPLSEILNGKRTVQRGAETRAAAAAALGEMADAIRRRTQVNLATADDAPDRQDQALLRQRVVPALADQLADADGTVQAAAATALAKAGLEAVPVLVTAVAKDDVRTVNGAQQSLAALGRFLPPPGTAMAEAYLASEKQSLPVPQFIELLKHRDPAVRAAGFRLFAQLGIGKSGAAAAPMLREGLSDPNADIRRHAAAALARLEAR
jgi:HEAT repeat protein